MKTLAIIPHEVVERKILFIRGKKVMLDKDLASLYEVETKSLTVQSKETMIVSLLILCFN